MHHIEQGGIEINLGTAFVDPEMGATSGIQDQGGNMVFGYVDLILACTARAVVGDEDDYGVLEPWFILDFCKKITNGPVCEFHCAIPA
jgi:hypothetical protein